MFLSMGESLALKCYHILIKNILDYVKEFVVALIGLYTYIKVYYNGYSLTNEQYLKFLLTILMKFLYF